MFSIGDTVSYPMHGVGRIEAIEQRSALGETADYYVLCFDAGRLTTMVPLFKAEQLGMRSILSPEECREVFNYISIVNPIKFSSDWNQRRSDITMMLHSGDLKKTIDVIISLNMRSGYRGLSTSEHRMITAATKALVSELHEVLDLEEEGIVEAINMRLGELRRLK